MAVLPSMAFFWFAWSRNQIPKKAFLILAGLTVILFLIQEAIYRLPNSSLCQKSSTVLCRDGGESIYFLMPSRAFEFLIGAATTFFPFAKFSKLGATFLNFISVGAILALAILIDPADKFPSFLGLAVCIFAGIIILTPRGYTSFILENCVIRFAGRISYSLYLFHWPVIVLWRYIDTKITLIDNVIMVLIFTFFATISYFLFEVRRPTDKLMSFANRNVRTGFTAMCLSTISFHGMANNGWTWRSVLPDDHLATESPQDLHKRYYGGYFNPLPSNKSPQYILSGDSYGATTPLA